MSSTSAWASAVLAALVCASCSPSRPQCNVDTDCPAGTHCDVGGCQAACTPGAACGDGGLLCTREGRCEPPTCSDDGDCDDGTFCDGVEVCIASDPDADARGCVEGEPPCDGECDEAENRCVTVPCPDADGDGARDGTCGGGDCDDANPDRAPGLTERCDLVDLDEDCDPTTFGFRDGDGDGFGDARCCNTGEDGEVCGLDCDDGVAAIRPGLGEDCNEIDDDCDGATDEGVLVTLFVDGDGDGFGDPATMVMGCPDLLPDHVRAGTDCDDLRADVNPAAREICDATVPPVDEDCAGGANPSGRCECAGDESRSCAEPGRCAAGTQRCSDGSWGGCSIISAAELCNGEDDDCDGTTDEGTTVRCFADADDDGFAAAGAAGSDVCPVPGRGAVGGCTLGLTDRAPLAGTIDCDDDQPLAYPGGIEVCDAAMVDEDCAGGANPAALCSCSGSATRSCSMAGLRGPCAAGIQTCSGGAWGTCSIAPVTETCNGLDDDCDGSPDDNLPIACWPDLDRDGYATRTSAGVCAAGGSCSPTQTNRDPRTGPFDCDDGDVRRYSLATEVCDGVDNDCNGATDTPVTHAPEPGLATGQCYPGRPLSELTHPPCRAGSWACRDGAWSCLGAVQAMPASTRQCGEDLDCDGDAYENVECGPGDTRTATACTSSGITCTQQCSDSLGVCDWDSDGCSIAPATFTYYAPWPTNPMPYLLPGACAGSGSCGMEVGVCAGSACFDAAMPRTIVGTQALNLPPGDYRADFFMGGYWGGPTAPATIHLLAASSDGRTTWRGADVVIGPDLAFHSLDFTVPTSVTTPGCSPPTGVWAQGRNGSYVRVLHITIVATSLIRWPGP